MCFKLFLQKAGLSTIFTPPSKNVHDQYDATKEYFPANPSPTVRRHDPIAKAKCHCFAAEEAKAGAFAYDAKRDRAGWALSTDFVKNFFSTCLFN
jgi:hypothetical protein